GRFLRAARVKRLGYDPAALSVAQFAELRRAAGRGRVWKALSGLVEGLRGQKDSSEIAQMRKAARLASNVLIDILKLLKPGVRGGPERIRHWYRAVREAQAAAVAAARAGVECGEVDGAARRVLAGYRLDRYFVHSTGHGLGLEVHEEPRVAQGQKQRLKPGSTITIEPGVYVPGTGGIRIEDDVAVLPEGSEVLTRVPRDFIELGDSM